jgi:death-on-curing protein
VSVNPQDCFHLTLDIIHEIHSEAIIQFGGSEGLRDLALLESAIAAPQATFAGQSPYKDIVEIAAAYLFYLCRNHPFIDGNKRTALGACIVFLRLNGIEPAPDEPRWEELTFAIASSQIDLESATQLLRLLITK